MSTHDNGAYVKPEPVREDFQTIRYALGDGNGAADDALDRIDEYIEALIEQINAR